MNNLLNNEYLTDCLIKIFHSCGTLLLFWFLSFGMIELAPGDSCTNIILHSANHPCANGQ
ncbi:hypothetical protein [Crocosphaera sp.]|uniref:hypothetical protein n=1 Tax=Crocosphaera sp. TaxID=2729996 RepID=UPI003F28C1CC|nr:hypothetical protein [Crocosphaera sp.]